MNVKWKESATADLPPTIELQRVQQAHYRHCHWRPGIVNIVSNGQEALLPKEAEDEGFGRRQQQ